MYEAIKNLNVDEMAYYMIQFSKVAMISCGYYPPSNMDNEELANIVKRMLTQDLKLD